MKRRYYNRNGLRERCQFFERQYGMTSEVFYEARKNDPDALHIPRFDAHLWASYWRDVLRLETAPDPAPPLPEGD